MCNEGVAADSPAGKLVEEMLASMAKKAEEELEEAIAANDAMVESGDKKAGVSNVDKASRRRGRKR